MIQFACPECRQLLQAPEEFQSKFVQCPHCQAWNTLIEAVAVLGNVEIKAPPEITVECDGDSLMGTFNLKYEGRASPSMASRDKIVRVTGSAYLGAVTIIVKGPDENFLSRITGGRWRGDS